MDENTLKLKMSLHFNLIVTIISKPKGCNTSIKIDKFPSLSLDDRHNKARITHSAAVTHVRHQYKALTDKGEPA